MKDLHISPISILYLRIIINQMILLFINYVNIVNN